MSRFVLLAEFSQSAPLAAQVTPEWLTRVAAACVVQLNRDVARHWGGQWDGRFGTISDIQPNEIAFGILDSLPQQPNAIAFHDTAGNAVPYALESLAQCQALDDVSMAISHELVEIAGDPYVNRWVDDETGLEYALELADPVQAAGYWIDGVKVSDFVLPSYFVTGALAPYSYTESVGDDTTVVGAPFQPARGGYQVRRTVGSRAPDAWGMQNMKDSKRLAKKLHWSSRTTRRRRSF